MNTKRINNKGLRYEISNFKLEHGLYLNPIVRRTWNIAVLLISFTQGIQKIDFAAGIGETLQPELDEYQTFFQVLTELHPADVFDALYIAAERIYGNKAA